MERQETNNRSPRLIWDQALNALVAVSVHAKERGQLISRRKLIVTALALAFTPLAQAAPLGGQLVSGSGSISQAANTTTITQASQNLTLNWQSFNIAATETVNFVQPSASAIAVNRIFDTNGTQILGHLNANGQVYLINPNGILFGKGAVLNVGGMVASTLNISNASLNSNARTFSGNGTGSVVNRGTINAAEGGYVALLGNTVSNQGTINAPLGSVALGAGSAATLTFAGNSLVKMQVDQSTLNNLAENGGLLRADGGQVIMTAGAKNALLASVVNNTGIIEARSVENHNGTITLLGGMNQGSVNIAGTLDASAPNGGNGGFIETSAAHVKVANDTTVTTAAAMGLAGTWLIDPADFTIGSTATGTVTAGTPSADISGATLSAALGLGQVTILSTQGSTLAGSGNINVNDVVSWSANKLTLNALNNININANLNASGSASLALQYGQGAVAAGNLSTYSLNNGAQVNLPAGNNFSTKLGSDGAVNNFTVITTLGASGSTTGTDLQGINGGLTGNYVLGSNINAANLNFVPIGNAGSNFTGTFDGLGHTISNLTINQTTDYIGLFGYAGAGSAIRNVGILGESVSGHSWVGGLVGYNISGAISNSYATGSVSSSDYDRTSGMYVGGLVGQNVSGAINNSYATSNISSSDVNNAAGMFIGGLVGRNGSGAISNSYATGSVTGNAYHGQFFAGLVGYNETGAISNSHATGTISASYQLGGLVGNNGGTISNSYATGNVNGSADSAGGLVAYNSGTVSDSYATGAVGGANFVGGLAGSNPGGTIRNSYATGSVLATDNVGGLVGSNFNGTISGSHAIGTVKGSTYTGGLAGLLGGSGAISNSYATGGVTVRTVGAGGLVGAAMGGSINNSYATGSVTGSTYVGGLAGYSFASITNSYATGSVSGSSYAGGLVGGSYCSVTNSYATGNVRGSRFVGGLVGSNGAIGAPASVSNSYAMGSVTGTSFVGGLAGRDFNTVTNSFWNKTVNTAPALDNGAGTGKTSAEMMQKSTFSSWNNTIANTGGSGAVWRIYEGHTTPLLISFLTPLTLTDAPDVTVSYTGAAQHGGSTAIGGVLGAAATGTNTGFYNGYYSTQQGYDIIGGNLTVNPLVVAISLSGNKVYDGTTAFSSGQLAIGNAASGDVVSLSAGTAYTADKNVGINKPFISFSGLTLTGASASNYTLTGVSGSGTINTLALTGSIATGSSIYGATLAPGAASFTNKVLNDDLGTVTVAVNTTGHLSSSGKLNAGSYTGIESVSALSGADAGNYTFAYITGNYNVSQLALAGTAIAAVSTTYGTPAAAGAVTFNNIVGSDAVSSTASINGQAFSTSGKLKAGSYTQTASSTLGGADAGNYSFAGYTTPGANYNVSQLALANAAIAAVSTTYGTPAAAGAVTFGNVVGNDAVSATASINGQAFSTSNKLNAGSYTQTASSTLAGADAANYSFADYTTPSANYSVGKLALTGSVATGSSIYGATLAPGAASFTNAINGDALGTATVTVNTTGHLSSSGKLNAGSYTGIESVSALSGADAGNYTFAYITGNYNISQLALAGTAIAAVSTTYGTPAAAGAVTFNNIVGSDAVSSTASINGQAFSTSGKLKAGSYTQTASSTLGGADAGNYSFAGYTTPGANYNVSQLALANAAIAAVSTTYGTPAAAGAVTFGNVVGNDAVSATASINGQAFSTSNKLNAGSYTQTASSTLGGADAANYSFADYTTPSANYSVGKLALTGSVATGSSIYGATLAPGAASFTNAINGDALGTATITVNTTGHLSSSGKLNAGSYTGIESVSALSGADAGNYTFAYITGNYNVSQLALAGTAIAAVSTTYGTPAAAGAVTFNNIVGSDAVSSTASIVSPVNSTSGHLAANNYQQTATTLTGTDAGNYSLAAYTTPTANYTVAKLATTVTATGINRVYDATPDGTVTLAGNAVISGDTVNFASTSATFADKNVGTAKTLSVSGISVGGADAGNYTLNNTTASTSANITPLGISVSGITTDTKVYDGTTSATLNLGTVAFGGVIRGDTVNISVGSISGSYANKNAGNNKAVNLSGVTLSGTDAGNYTMNGVAGVTGSITPLALTGTTIASANSVYGATVTPGAVTFGNVIGNDDVTSTASIVNPGYSSSGHLTANTYRQTATTLNGTDAGNYTLAAYTTPTANYTVSKLALTNTAIAAAGSVYGVTVTPGAVTFGNLIGADKVTSTASIVNPDYSSTHLNANTYQQTATTLAGTDAGNYSLAAYTTQTANYTVTQAALAVTANNLYKSFASVDPALTYGYSGLVDGDVAGNVLGGSLARVSGENTGLYTVNQGSLQSNGNYALTFTPGSLRIVPLVESSQPAIPAAQPSLSIPSSLPNLVAEIDSRLANHTGKENALIAIARRPGSGNGPTINIVDGGIHMPGDSNEQ